jgi:enoyl-CoA hydratase/carnithine racemase
MLEIHDHGAVREIRLVRPPVNALNPALVAALDEALESAAIDAGAVVLSGTDGMFSAGLDVPQLLSLDRAAMGAFWRSFHGLLERIARLPVPIAAAITGHSPAGGAVISLFCDVRFMSRGNFRFGFNETRVGLRLPPPIHGALVRLVGAHRAERLIVSGDLMLPDAAFNAGLLDALADDPAATRGMAIAWSESLLALPRTAMLGNRATLRESLTGLFDDPDRQGHGEFLGVWFSEETQATLRALVAQLKSRSS